jgi:hypothetical protein
MASETSELTFVRCPTCRSLVPASASRCRICNATLEAGEQAPSGDGQAGSGRVRQKTVTASPDEVADMVASASTPAEPPPAVRGEDTSHSEQSFGGTNDDGFDPLGAYLQDLDSSAGSGVTSGVAPAAVDPVMSAPSSVQDEHDDADDFDLDLFDDPTLEEPVVAAKPHVVPEPELDPLDFLDDPIADEPPPPPPVQRAPVEPKRPPMEAREARESRPEVRPEARQQVRQETRQAPPPPRPQQLQQPKQESRQVRETPPPSPRNNQPNNPPARPKVNQPPPQQQRQEPRPPREDQGRRDRPQQQQQNPRSNGDQGRSFAGPKPHQQGNGKPQAQHTAHKAPPREEPDNRHREEPHEARRPHTGSGPRAGKIQAGRLFGWLVSFENPDGRAIELRGGRFFITGTSIRDTDLILEDQSISTPHALMSITDRGMMVQDLMSDRGTFVRTRGDSQYRREDGIIEVQHGDWLRFGDVEFLVTIVPTGD